MSNEIAKIYQFIDTYNKSGQNFMTDADYDRDGVIIKSEFEQFLDKNLYAATADVIDTFWKSIDTNDSEQRIEGTNLKNYRTVTADEANRIEQVVQYYEELKDFCNLNLKAPENLTGTQQALWIKDMEAQLNEYYNAFVAGEIDKYDLATKYNELVISITPHHAAEDMMRKLKTASDLAGLDYDWEIDWNGQLGRKANSVIKKFIKQNPNATPEEIVEEAQKVVNGMLINAGFGEPYTEGPEAYEFTQSKFTELQEVILDNELISDDEIREDLLAGETDAVIDKLFKRFYSGYFHQELSVFADQRAGAVEAFKLWFNEYGATILNEIKNDGVAGPEGPDSSSSAEGTGGPGGIEGADETSSVTSNKCTFTGILSSYTIERGATKTINGSIDIDRSIYPNAKISFEGYADCNITSTITGDDFEFNLTPQKSGKFTIIVSDTVTGEILATQEISINVPTYYKGTVWMQVIAEDHRNADSQRQVQWSFYVDESDEIKEGPYLVQDLYDLAYKRFSDAFYGEDIVEIQDLSYE